MSRFKIAPSILSADFGRLAEAVQLLERAGSDLIHVDVMDGCFVPNITIGQPVVAALRKATTLPLDVHLMIEQPDRHLAGFAEAGADVITVHVESTTHVHRTLQAIRALGKRVGIALNPGSALEPLPWLLDEVDMILVMSVNPGFGGQRFIANSLARIAAVREMVARAGRAIDIEVDGGVVLENAAAIAKAGANVLVSGTGIVAQADPARAIAEMRARAEEAGGP